MEYFYHNIFQADAASRSPVIASTSATRPSLAFAEASIPSTSAASTSKSVADSSLKTLEIHRDLARHIAAADKVISKIGKPDLSDDEDFGFDIPDEVMEAVNNGELDLNDIYMPDLALASNAGNLGQASNAGEGPSGYLQRSQTSQWRDRKRHLVENDHDKVVDCCGDVLGRFGKKVVKKMRADPELAKKILEKLDEPSSDENEGVTPARLVAHTHANELR